jgi:hypothetical protein
MTFCPIEVELLHADGRKDRHDEANNLFRHHAEAPNNLGYIYNGFTEVTLYFYESLISYFHYVRSYLPWIFKSFFQCPSNRFRANVYEV